MSEWEIDGQEVSPDLLWQLIEDFESDDLSPTTRRELFHILEESPKARSLYLSHCELSALLQITAETKKEEGTLPVVSRAGGQRKILGYSVMAAAAVLILIAFGAALVKLRKPEIQRVTLEATAQSLWTISGPENENQFSLKEGSTLEVSSGTVSLTCNSGARIIVQGPALVSFPTFETPVVKRGWFWVDSGKEGNTLTIATPAGKLTNLGTRFGVRVRSDHQAELHLINGLVELAPKSGDSPVTFEASGEGVLFSKLGPGRSTTLAPDPFPGVDEMLRSGGGYANIILGQSPFAYWKLEGDNSREVQNEVTNGSRGLYSTGVLTGAVGVRPDEGWYGFDPDNRGVYLSGARNDSVVYGLDYQGGVSPREGAASFWFRREPDLKQAEVLWFAGLPGAGGLGPLDEMQVFLSEDGRIKFFMEEGQFDILLSSPIRTNNGRWHHVVATWNSEGVELYLDGKMVSRNTDHREANGPTFQGSNVRIGKTGSGTTPSQGRNLMPFRGWMDELALWGRHLTAAEITQQFRAAKGRTMPANRPAPPNE